MGGRTRKVVPGLTILLVTSVLVGCDPLPRHPDNGLLELDVLALGDSFTAGNGAKVYGQEDYGYYPISPDDPRESENIRDEDWSPLHPYGCFRNRNNYSRTLYDALGSRGAYVNGACSGDTTDNILAPLPPDAQIVGFNDDQREEFDLITLTIGGNDLGFADIMQQCFVGFSDDAIECQARLDDAITMLGGSPSQLYLSMRDTLERVARDFPNARIVLVGYPLIFEDENYTISSGEFDVQPGRIVESWLNQLNLQQQAVVDEVNTEHGNRLAFLPLHHEDGSGVFDGHGLEGSLDRWINPPRSVEELPFREEWFHPDSSGQAAIAETLYDLPIVRQLVEDLLGSDPATPSKGDILYNFEYGIPWLADPGPGGQRRFAGFPYGSSYMCEIEQGAPIYDVDNDVLSEYEQSDFFDGELCTDVDTVTSPRRDSEGNWWMVRFDYNVEPPSVSANIITSQWMIEGGCVPPPNLIQSIDRSDYPDADWDFDVHYRHEGCVHYEWLGNIIHDISNGQYWYVARHGRKYLLSSQAVACLENEGSQVFELDHEDVGLIITAVAGGSLTTDCLQL